MPKKKIKFTKRHFYNLIISVPIVGMFSITSLGFFGNTWWLFDLMAHFRVQYILICLILVGLVLFSKNKNIIFISFFSLLINLLLVNPFLIPNFGNNKNANANLKILFMNININHRDPQSLVEYIQSENPDIVGIAEITEKNYQVITDGLPQYNTHLREGQGIFGIALLSKIDDTKDISMITQNTPLPSLETEIIVNEKPIQVIVTHPFPPISNELTKRRDTQLSVLGKTHVDKTTPTILMGDLNATPWSAPYLELIRDTKLNNTRKGFGINGSWPTRLPLMFKIPIDHILVSDDFTVTNFEVGKDIGSDHMPVVAEVEIY